jgi:hypothetical protein
MIFCLVYENVQNHPLTTADCPAMTNNILRNAVVLIQYLWFIENGERFSPKYAQLDEENISELNHDLGFAGYGVDDFMSNGKKGYLSLIGLRGHSRRTILTCIFQMLKLYLK